MTGASKRSASRHGRDDEGWRSFRAFAKTSRFWGLVLAVPTTLLVLPLTALNLLAPAVLLKGFHSALLFVGCLLFAAGMSLLSVLVYAWTWIKTGKTPHINDKKRRRFFFGLLCAGDLYLVYIGMLLSVRSWFFAVIVFTSAAAVGYSLLAILRRNAGARHG